MKKLYYNIEQKTKQYSNIFLLLSIISWIFFIMTSFYSIINIYEERAGILFTIVKYPLYNWISQNINYTGGTIYPLQMHPIFFYIIIIIISVISLFSFIIYLILINYKKKISILDEMLPAINNFNFIPLFSISICFLIGETYLYNVSRWERRNILGFIFNIIGLSSILLIYYNYKIKINNSLKYFYIIKKGAYSCIICLEWYYFCYIMTNIFVLYLSDDYYFSIIKIFEIILPLIFCIGVFIFSYIFKDILIAFLSCLINIGCAFYFFSIDKIYRKQYNEYIDGIIYIIISILLIAEIIFICIKYKKFLLN